MNEGKPQPEARIAVPPKKKKKGMIRILIFAALFMAVMVIGATTDLGDNLKKLSGWIEGFGIWAPLIFILLYALATVFALPGAALTLVAGGLFGSVEGVVVVSVASTLGAGLAFLVSRYLMRRSIVDWLGDNPKFRKLDRMTERHGSVAVALTRLIPIFPFNLLNYGFGLTKVPFRAYIFWSWLCMLPGTVLYVVGGDAIKTALEEGRPPWALIVVLVVVAVIITGIGNHVRGILKKKQKEDEEDAGRS